MRHFSRIRDVKTFLGRERKKGKKVGFVPTMGALHEGHTSLVKRSVQDNDITVCSIFVNPIQFNSQHDLDKYPRNLERDLAFLEESGCDIVFAPDTEEMYPGGKTEELTVDFGYLDKILEGKYRPGHFRGVAIVVQKLFGIVEPDKAYFGKKDHQQLLVIRQLVTQLQLPVIVEACPIVRETDGLAMSSRNMRLTIGERQLAPIIFEVLTHVKDKIGTIPVKELKNWAIKKIEKNPSFKVDYFEISDKETLLPIENWKSKGNAMALIASYLGDVRLIDNIEFFS